MAAGFCLLFATKTDSNELSLCCRGGSQLSGPTATVTLSRYTAALHSVALRFPGFGGVAQENRGTPPEKGPVAPAFSAFKGGVALQVAPWKVSRCMGVSQLRCRLRTAVGHLGSHAPWFCKPSLKIAGEVQEKIRSERGPKRRN